MTKKFIEPFKHGKYQTLVISLMASCCRIWKRYLFEMPFEGEYANNYLTNHDKLTG